MTSSAGTRRGFFNVVLALTLVATVGISLWFASPVKALDMTISNPSPLTLGRNISFTVSVDIEDTELLPINSIHLYIYKSNNRATYEATCANLLLITGSQNYSAAETGGGAVSIAATAATSWGYGYGYVNWRGYGYYFFPPGGYGYGYSGTGATSMTYDITWTSPASWSVGAYKAEVRIIADGVQFTKTKSFTLTKTGEGGGGYPRQPKPGSTDVSDVVGPNGIFGDNVMAQSDDGNCSLYIPMGTKGLTGEGLPLRSISMVTMSEESRPPLPAGANVIGLVYDFGPDEATFVPAVTLSFIYDESLIPEGVAEGDLVIAYWDADAGKWILLDDITVDAVHNTISGKVSHFTAFSLLGYERAVASTPAFFELGQLSISPPEVEPGKEVMVAVTVSNTGGQSGSYEVILKVDGVVAGTQNLALEPGTGREATFTVSKDIAGIYTVDVNGLAGEFVVKSASVYKPQPPALPLLPAIPQAKPVNWWLVGAVVAGGCVVIGGIIVLVVRRRRGK